MKVNQNNQNIRQITPEEIAQAEGLPKPLTGEELQKTQILNLNELENTIRFEKITSKKPAIIVAALGIFLLIFGATFQIATSLSSNKNQVQKRKVDKTPQVVETSLSCVKTTLNNPDGTDTVYNVDYYFENDKLSSEIREYKYTAIANNPNGEPTVKSKLDTYQKLLLSSNGYQVNTNANDSKEIKVVVQIDYHSLDLTTIPQANQNDSLTKVTYKRNIDSNTIKNDMLTQGFTCE